jgi:hypothetical protein
MYHIIAPHLLFFDDNNIVMYEKKNKNVSIKIMSRKTNNSKRQGTKNARAERRKNQRSTPPDTGDEPAHK